MFKKLLLAYDGSDPAKKAVDQYHGVIQAPVRLCCDPTRL